jgi:hypothetical protein
MAWWRPKERLMGERYFLFLLTVLLSLKFHKDQEGFVWYLRDELQPLIRAIKGAGHWDLGYLGRFIS